MVKALYADPDLCTGCRICELVCAFVHNKTFSPQRSAIRLMAVEPGGVRVPVFCIRCGLCIHSCPVNALGFGKARAVVVDKEKCNGSALCVVACPFGAAFVDPKTNKAVICDLCGGEPACVKYCPSEALKYEDANVIAYWRRKDEARGRSMTSLYRKLWRYREKEEGSG